MQPSTSGDGVLVPNLDLPTTRNMLRSAFITMPASYLAGYGEGAAGGGPSGDLARDRDSKDERLPAARKKKRVSKWVLPAEDIPRQTCSCAPLHPSRDEWVFVPDPLRQP